MNPVYNGTTLQMLYRRDKTSTARQKLASTQDPPVILLILQVSTGRAHGLM